MKRFFLNKLIFYLLVMCLVYSYKMSIKDVMWLFDLFLWIPQKVMNVYAGKCYQRNFWKESIAFLEKTN